MSTAEQTNFELENPPVRKGARDLAIGERGLMINSYVELMQMAALYHKSGLAPNSLDTLEKVAIGMATCLEVGVPIVTGLQHVAVINGKASIWGDLVMSIVRGSGLLEEYEETETGAPYQDDWTFTCKIKRRGLSPATGRFTWADAKRAGLHDPQRKGGGADQYSPWRRFPKRMMQWAARRWVIRDNFADLLKGIVLAEDALDAVALDKGPDGSYSVPEKPAQKPQERRAKPVYQVKDLDEAATTPEPVPITQPVEPIQAEAIEEDETTLFG